VATEAVEVVRNTERVRVRTTTTSCDDDDDDDRRAPPTRLTRDRPKSQTAHGGTVAMVTSGSGGGIEAFALRTPSSSLPTHPPFNPPRYI